MKKEIKLELAKRYLKRESASADEYGMLTTMDSNNKAYAFLPKSNLIHSLSYFHLK